MRALYVAATGMAAQDFNVQTISNNIANMRTTGYKRMRADFKDMVYQHYKLPGSAGSGQTGTRPEGVFVGSGVAIAGSGRVTAQGVVSPTQRPYDLAIRGEGYFAVRMDNRTAYTRDGRFSINADGAIVTQDGRMVEPGLTIPANATAFTVNASGLVQVTLANQSQPQTIGQLQVTRFINPAGLESIGDNLFVATEASGSGSQTNPGQDGAGQIEQAALESSNVEPVTEIASLIAAQRAYEMNSKVVSACDQMQQSTSQMFRG